MEKIMIKEEREKGPEREKGQESHQHADTTLAQIVMNQTTYTEDEALTKLGLHNNDICKVLREFMSIPEPPAKKITSINQSIYKEIRRNLGIVDIDYNMNNEE